MGYIGTHWGNIGVILGEWKSILLTTTGMPSTGGMFAVRRFVCRSLPEHIVVHPACEALQLPVPVQYIYIYAYMLAPYNT